MRGFTDFAGRLTRLVYCKERGEFLAETVPHAFARGTPPDPRSPGEQAGGQLEQAQQPCPTTGDKHVG